MMMLKDYIYFSSINRFMSPHGDMFTEEELDYYMELEKEWKDSQPNYAFQELMKIFPESIKPARRGLKAKMKVLKERITEINESQESYQTERINKVDFREQAELKRESDKDFEGLRQKVESKIKTCVFQLAHLDEMEGKTVKKNFGGVDEREIAEARLVPITNFYTDKLRKSGQRAVGLCPFHSEKTASFYIYLDQNSFYCQGCNFGGGVIDYVMRQQGIDFLSAVKFLIKK